MKAIREINRYDYELYDLLENYFIKKNYPTEIKSLLEKLLTTMKKDYFNNIDKSYKGNKNDIIYEKELEEITFNDGISYKREVIFDVLILYSLLNDRKLTFPNISKKYQNLLWDLFKKVEDYENGIDTNPHLDIKEINYYIETELEDDN